MKKDRSYKVKYGYNVADQVSVTEQELERAIYAQLKGTPMQLGSAFVNGRNIIAITPDYHKHTGWNAWYEPKDGEDWGQIKRDCPDYDGMIEYVRDRVSLLMKSGRVKEIGKGTVIPEILPPAHAQDLIRISEANDYE